MSHGVNSSASEPEKSVEGRTFEKVQKVLSRIFKQEYFPKFTENEMTDEALQCVDNQKEMQDVLKEMVPLGVALQFSKTWFCCGALSGGCSESSESEKNLVDDVRMTKPEIKESNVSLIDYRKDKNIQLQMLKEYDADATVSIPTGKIPSNVEHLQTGDASVISSQSEDSSPKSSLKNADRPLTSSTTENRAFENETLNAGLDINSNCVAESSEVVTEQPTKTPISTRFVSMSDMADKGVAKNLKKEISSTSNIDERRDPVINNTTCTSRNQEDLKVKCEEALPQSPPSTNNECSHTPESSFKQKHQSLVQNSDHVAVGNSSPTFKYPAEIKNAFCSPRPFGIPVKGCRYSRGCVFKTEENRETEYKALTGEIPERLPWKIMEKAREFICGILNSGGKGTIYFGIGDSYDSAHDYQRGEIVGLAVEELKDEIIKAFQSMLNDHIKSDDGKMQKGGDMEGIEIHFVPVDDSEEQACGYVIEIEIRRDWKHCKEKVYYLQEWKEKRNSQGGRLNDLYKVTKEKWEDPVIRTCGQSTKVKNIDIEKQIREPLSQKYKEFMDCVKKSQIEISSDYVNSEDVQKYSARIRESLRELNFKENSYILIADKVPREHRGSTSLAFLQSIPWIAVFDLFDPSSREDGLHYIFNETSDSARATVKELGDFKNIQPGEDMSTRGTTWIFRDKSMHESDWVCNSKDSLYRALSAYKERSPTGRIHCVFLAFGDESSEEMADVVESSFSIIGRHAGRYITIISEKKEIINGIVRYSKPGIRKDVTNSSLSGFPWKLFKSNVKDMLGPTHFHEPGATTELPYFAGKTMPVLNKRLNSLTDLEMYFPYPSLPDSVSEIEKARDNFYKGGVVNQLNLFHQHDIERTHQMDLTSSIDHYLKDLSKASSDMSSHVETVTLRYEPGSGATTLCRRILWNKKSTYRCAVVKAITPDTDYQIEVLYSFLFNADMPYQPPVLILVDNFGEQDVRQLMDKVSDRKVKCVFLNAVPIAKSSESGDENVAELRQLDKTEIKRVKQVLVDVTSEDDSRREAAEKVLEREKRFIWLGLELFGRDYFDIKQRLSGHIKHIISKNLMDESKDFYQMILRFSCLLDYYSKGRSIFPHPCATDILFQGRGPSAEPIDYIEVLHHKFGGLLLEGFNESNGCHGWRPAHALVGEVVRKEMDLLSVTKELLVKMNGGYSYAKKYLISDAVTVCLEREKKYDVRSDSKIDAGFALETGVDDDISGILEVRTRYSPLIKDINLNPDPEVGVDNALDILITLNENVTTDQHKARTWQQIARVIAYEIGMKKVSSANLQIGRVKRLVGPSAESGKSLTHGFEVAHLAIDQAIKIQESYVHHLVTKGAFFMAELRELEKRSCIGTQDVAAMIKQAITTCKEGIRVYDNALRKSVQDYHNGYLHSMVGKIQMVVRLLEVFKRLPYFTQHTLGPDESFKSYMNEGVHPDELNGLFDEDELTYLLSLRGTAVELSNDLFEEIKLRRTQTYKSYEIHELNNVKLRALKLRRLFYDVTKLDRTHLSHDLGYHEDIVNDIFSQYDETPFSSWKRLSNSKVAKIYQTLHSAVRKMPISSTGMLVYARAALQVQEKPTMSELAEYVDYWCQRCPKSVWAHLFNYMIHFPVPNFPISKNVTSVKSSIAMCNNSSQIRKSQRRSGAEYLLGKGMGLDAIVRPHELSESGQDMNGTKFWQSYTVVERLERLRGRKVRQGVLSYRDIEILFDNERYPKDSRDDLWFCLGFTVNGPYAYDPINNDGYQTLKKLSCRDTKLNDRRQEPTNSLDSSSSATETRSPAKSGDKCTTSRSKAKTTYTPPTRKTPTPISNLSAKHTDSSVVSESKKELPTTSNSASETPASTHGQTSRESWKTCPKLAIALRSSGGSQVIFRPTQVDKQGRVHHGTPVRGSRKSADCFTHKSGKVPQNCNFAHFWCGDTLQFICTKCTDEHKVECKDKNKHASFIHNLGAYRNRDGEDWRLKK